MRLYALIVAGGKGERMGSEIPKQFLEVSGKPILMHTISVFSSSFEDIHIILVLPKNQINFWKNLCKVHRFSIPHQIAEGGKARFDSVKKGLSFITEEGLVGIHDGVRPLVSEGTIKRTYNMAGKNGTAVPVVDLVDSIRKVTKQESKSVKRSCYKAVQTPQCFSTSIVLEAYKQEEDSAFTDDASVVEKAGHSINLVEGNAENIKVTSKKDLKVVEALLGK